jgi:hypothetical protein
MERTRIGVHPMYEHPQLKEGYDPPRVVVLGPVSTLTLQGRGVCFHGKREGGSDGMSYMGVQIPIASC